LIGDHAMCAVGIVDVPNGALVARASREARTASTLARCLVSIRFHVSGFVTAVKGGHALRACGVVNVAYIALIASGGRKLSGTSRTCGPCELGTATALACCPCSVRCDRRSSIAAVYGRRALRAVGVVDVACSALVARAPSETRIASTHTCCLFTIRCHITGFATAVNGTRALRTVGVRDGADRTRFRTRFSDAVCVRLHPRICAGFCADIGVCDV